MSENEEHISYIEGFGWHIDKIHGTSVYPKGEFSNSDRLDIYSVSTLDLNPYLDEEVNSTSYKLLETYNDSNLYGIVYEVKNKILRGILGLEDYNPGVSSLDRDDIPKVNK